MLLYRAREGVQMQIEYVGPKTLISTHGVYFDNNKEDKFIYLNCILQLIQAIDHEYIDDKVHTYTADNRKLCDEAINAIKQYCPNAEAVIAQAKESADTYIDEELRRGRDSIMLNDEEIRVLINNIMLMRHYIIQRHINKSIYYYAVEKFIEHLRHARIDYISAPVHETFLHVFRTVQRSLLQQRSPLDSQLTFYQKDKNLLLKLDIM